MDLNALKVGEPEKFVDALAGRLVGCRCVEGACSLLCSELYDRCRWGSAGERALVMTCIYLSLPFDCLDPDTASFVTKTHGDPKPGNVYLTLMGTHGKEPQWCDRKLSAPHRCIPFAPPSPPKGAMLAACFKQIGFELSHVGPSEDTMPGRVWTPLGLFLIEEALSSETLAAEKEFVKTHSVWSVVGCGATLPDGAISLWLGFSREHVSEEGALPMLTLMPAFWQVAQDLYRRKALFG